MPAAVLGTSPQENPVSVYCFRVKPLFRRLEARSPNPKGVATEPLGQNPTSYSSFFLPVA